MSSSIASSMEIESADVKKIPVKIVAYDHRTGFSLLRSASPPVVKPLELGNSKYLAPKQPSLVMAHGGTANAIGGFE